MRKRQILKINLSSIFMVLLFLVAMGIAYSMYTERYYGGNNYITMGNVYLRGYGDDSLSTYNIFPEGKADALDPRFHPYREVTAGRDTIYVRDNEIAFILDGRNNSKENIKFKFFTSPGESIEGKERAPSNMFSYYLKITDFESGDIINETSNTFYSSYSISSTSNKYELKANGGQIKWLVSFTVYYSSTSTVYESSSSSLTADVLKNYYLSLNFGVENDGNSSIDTNPSISNIGLYKMIGKSYIDNIVFEHEDENDLIQSIVGLNRLDYDDEIDLNDMDDSYIDFSYSFKYNLTNNYSNASECSLLSTSFCNGLGFYPGTYSKLSSMFDTYGLYMNRNELDELEENGIVSRTVINPSSFSFGFVEDGTLTIKYSDSKVYLPRDSQYFFAGFCNVESIDFTNLSTEQCVSLAFMFRDDVKINNVDLRHNIKKNWINLFGMFYNCQSLVNYSFNYYANNLTSFCNSSNTSSDYRLYYVKDMGYMFYHCTSLTTDPNNHYFFFDDYSSYGSSLQNLQHMFEGCTSLTTVAYYNGSYGLLGCAGNFAYDMSYMYKDCTNLVSFGDTTSYTSRYISINNTTNLEGMFYNCTSLTMIPMQFYWYNSGVTNPITGSSAYSVKLDYIYYNCSNATRIVTYSSGGSSFNFITSISHAFENCSSLTEYSLSTSYLMGSLRDASFCFKNCTALNKIDMQTIITSSRMGNGVNLESMFEGCTSFTTISSNSSSNGIFNFKFDSPANMKNMFKGCTGLINITFDNCIFDIAPDNFNSLFTDCGHIKFFIITNSTFGYKFGNGIDSNNKSIYSMNNVFTSNYSFTFSHNSMLYFTSLTEFKGGRTFDTWEDNTVSPGVV